MVGNIVVQKMIVDQLAKRILLVRCLEIVCQLFLLKSLHGIGLQHLVELVQALIASEIFLHLFRPKFFEGEDFLVAKCDCSLEIDIVHLRQKLNLRQKLRVMMSVKLTIMMMMMMRIVAVEVE